jgi:cytochrome c oxidase subunit 2
MGAWLQSLFRGTQSALDPAGPNAAATASLSWVLFCGGTLILLLVVALTALALRPGRNRRFIASRVLVIAGGIALPLGALTALLVYGLVLARDIVAKPGPDALAVRVVGEQFWWRVAYEGPNGEAIETANEIRIPTGRPVVFTLTTADVIHSFWIPNLGGKLDMIPGQTNTLVLQADRAGLYRGQCTEYCGGAHALMAFDVMAQEPNAFDAWLAEQGRPAAEPADPFVRRGAELFLAAGCGACHTVRGTAAAGRIGPDLTHIGSRRSIAAASFPNNKGTLAGWITSSQHLKPSNRMPSFNVFSGEELRAVASYLESLK